MAIRPETIADITIDSNPKQLQAASLYVTTLTITSLSTNSDIIRVGDSNVSTSRGTPLSPGDSATFTGDERPSGTEELDLSDFYLHADTANDVVAVEYFRRKP